MTVGRADDRWTYWIVLAVQTLGASVLYWHVVPLYRRVLADPTAYVPDSKTLTWILLSITLMQLGYWYSFRIRLALPPLVQPVLGLIVLCLARFGFIVASGFFFLVFVSPNRGFSLPIGRYIATLLGLFAVFCYTQELERLGRGLQSPAPGR